MNFKNIIIQLKEPICDCPEQKISWCPTKDDKDKPTLTLWCETCNKQMIISNKMFRAVIQFDKPYPGKPKVKEIDPEQKKINEDLQKEVVEHISKKLN